MVVPGIGRTLSAIFECVLTIGTRSAQSIRASGHTCRINRPDTCDRTRPMLQKRQKVLARGAVHT